jgi:hypothetical protein
MQTLRVIFVCGTILFFQLLYEPPIILGQANNRGEISGEVLDTTGAVIAGAVVELAHLGAGFRRETITNESGYYTFPLLEPGMYELKVTNSGFKLERRSPVTVSTSLRTVVNFKLEPGTVEEEVIIRGDGEVVRSGDVTLTSIVTQSQLRQLPLNEKILSEFTRLEAGGTPRGLVTAESSGINTDSGGWINGLRQFFVHITLDGGHFNDPTFPGGNLSNTAGISFDAVGEFSVIKGNADATQASAAGYIVNISTRRGSDNLHGDIFEFLRNNIFDARNFFDGATTQPLRRNQFGGSLSGSLPIRRSKDFFFVNYEGFRRASSGTIVIIAPTERLLSNVPSGPENGYLREILRFTYPRPNPATHNPNAPVAPVNSRVNLGLDRDSFVIRVDNELTHKTHSIFRYNFMDGTAAPGVQVATGVRGGNGGFNWRYNNALFGLNSVFSQRSVNDLRLTYDRTLTNFFADPTPDELVSLGFDPTANTPNGLPFITFAGTGMPGIGALPLVPKKKYSDVFELSNTLSTIRSNHNLSFGVTLRHIDTHWLLGENTRPSTVFVGFGPPFDSAPFGITTGRFLSQTQNIAFDSATPIRNFEFNHFAAFIQDSYRFSNNLSIFLGLRYSFDTPINEANGLLSNVYPVNPQTGNIVEGGDVNEETVKSLALGSVDKFRFTRFDWNNFAPNIGVAWSPTQDRRTIVKAGYSVAYGSLWTELIRLVGFNPPFGVSTILSRARFGERANSNSLTVPPALNAYNPSSVNPYVQSWNLTLERELESNTVLRASYIGNRGTNLWNTRQPNFGAGFLGNRPNPSFSVINLTETKAGSNYNAFRLEVNRRFSKGLAFQGTYVFAKSLDDISAGATIFRPTGIGSLPTDQRNPRENYGLSDFDVRHTAVVNFSYELPFGRKQRMLNIQNRVLSTLVSNWSLSGIISFWDGIPFDILSGIDNNGDGVVNDRARVLPGAQPAMALVRGGGVDGNTQYFEPSSSGTIFSQTTGAPLQRNFFRGPHIFNTDLAVRRTISLTDRADVELTAEAFNLFNHTNFSNPVNTLSSPIFGRLVSTYATGSRQLQFGVKLNF